MKLIGKDTGFIKRDGVGSIIDPTTNQILFTGKIVIVSSFNFSMIESKTVNINVRHIYPDAIKGIVSVSTPKVSGARMSEYLGVDKYVDPIKINAGDAAIVLTTSPNKTKIFESGKDDSNFVARLIIVDYDV